MPVRQLLLLPQTKYLLYGVLALPFVWLIWALFHDALGANPAEALSRATGDWTLRLLCLVLAVTPLRRLTGLSELIRFRRSIGLACFYYACLHLLCYAWFDQSFEVNEMVKDLVKRPFIWLGMICFVLMLPLALTSHNAAVRWLGGKRWQQLHKWVYVLPVFALLHFYWMRAGKNNFAEVWVYLAILSGLLLSRLWFKLNKINVR
ncbi:MAG: sulfoxide reductase heme-binding subunit YedZ [Betaproteobacteria bacterium]|nr:sulfoxide reductase heme-binding subunit YedZ [Betaproteobacteria bacterium]